MGLNNVTSIDFVSSDATIVGSLGSWKSIFGPSKRVQILIQQSVLLFDAKPGLLVLGFYHDLIAGLAVIGLGRQFVVLVSFAHDKLIVTQTHRIPV